MSFKSKSRITKPFLATISLMIVAVCCFIVQSCQKNENKDVFDTSVPKLNISEEYSSVGEFHNKGLDFVFSAIRLKVIENMKESGTDLKSAKTIDYGAIIKEAALNFCKEDNRLIAQSKGYEASVNIEFARFGSSELKSAHIFKPIQTELLSEIRVALKNKYTKKDLAILKKSLDEISLKASRKLSNSEAASIYCAVSTAYSSYQYWLKNYKKWYFATHYPEVLQKYNDAQLNKLSFKSGSFNLKGGVVDPSRYSYSFWEGMFDEVEGWFIGTWEDFCDWWDYAGEDIVQDDITGAVEGLVTAYESGALAAGSALGPEGTVAVGAAYSIGAAVVSSALTAASK